MTQFTARLDGGDGGEQTFEAADSKAALALAITWARQGDWPEDGCMVEVTIWADGDDYASEREEIQIVPALEARADSGEVLAERQNEWDTDQVVRVGDDYFLRCDNGGRCGFRDRQQGDGSWATGALSVTEIDRTEARRLLLELGWTATLVAKATA